MKIPRNVLRRGPVVAVSVAVVAGASLLSPATAAAQPPPTTAPLTTAATTTTTARAVLEGVAPGPHTVTLVTGDRVTVDTTGGGLDIRSVAATRPDGSVPSVRQRSAADGIYVIPSDAQAAVDAGLLDKKLFDVKYLLENGYADADTDRMPVIVQYPPARARSSALVMTAAQALPASTATVQLESVGAAGVSVAKSQASGFWASIRGTQTGIGANSRARGLGAGVATVWLDRKVHTTLAESVPLIGAPQAWAAGHDGSGVTVAVLDTGIDAAHPDLADTVVSSRSFVPGLDSVMDGNGHGTHVASTIAGSGAASGGARRGVAPGADLMVGKVLDDTGSGDWSWVMEGMEWAATSGADIVSLSLGACCTDGTDLVAETVNRLTAETGTLFVIAAGNDGQLGDRTVNTPGVADAALTVSATSKTDELASFSSRGPRLVDSALKPDIAAPGVQIVAARSSEFSIENPTHVDENYTTLSGTSMATPHVAGAAAIVAQQHPDWTPAQIKAALMSTATDAGYTAYEQGAGRLDVARADAQTVVALTPNADFASVIDGAGTLTRDVTYANHGTEPVTLTLTPTLTTTAGEQTPGSTLTADGTLAVPAGGTATATVTLSADALSHGTYTGVVVATDAAGTVRLRTPVGVVREPRTVPLTIRSLDREGGPIDQTALELVEFVAIVDVLGPTGFVPVAPVSGAPGTLAMNVPEGTYNIGVDISWVDDDLRLNFAMLVSPEVVVAGQDTTVTFDLRDAQPIRVQTPLPTESTRMKSEMTWERTSGTPWDIPIPPFVGVSLSPYIQLWAQPTQRPAHGTFTFHTGHSLTKPRLVMNVRTPQEMDLHPAELTDYMLHSAFPAGTHTVSLVDTRSGRADQIAGLNLRGRIALVDDDPDDGNQCGIHGQTLDRLAAAGVVGVLVLAAGPRGSCSQGPTLPLAVQSEGGWDPTVPFASLSPKEGQALRGMLARTPVTLTFTSTPVSPYVYSVPLIDIGRVPDSLTYRLTSRDVARVDIDIHSARPQLFAFLHFTRRPGQVLPVQMAMPAMIGPARVTEYIGPLYSDALHTRMWNKVGDSLQWTRPNVFDRPTRSSEHYNAGVATLGAITPDTDALAALPPGNRVGFCSICRQGDTFWPVVHQTMGAHDTAATSLADWLTGPDGQPITLTGGGATLPAQPGTYRVAARTWDGVSTAEWTVRSNGTTTRTTSPRGVECLGSTPTDGGSTQPCRAEPAVFVRYNLEDSLALDNSTPAGDRHTFTAEAYHSPSAESMPRIAGLRLWTSTDDGRTWIPARVRHSGGGHFTITARYPRYEDTTGSVSLRVQAWDAQGNEVTQTTDHAFGLRDVHPKRPRTAV